MKQCISGKKSYSNQGMAEDALIDSWEKNYYSAASAPINVYQCMDCGDWHWTSKGEMNVRLAEEIRSKRLHKKREANDWEKRLK